MMPTIIQRSFALDDRPVIDRWLRFAPPVQARYEEDHGRQRAAELRVIIIAGLVFYNVYSLTSILLMPDIAVVGIILRLAIFTPAMLGLAWLVGHAPPRWNERMICVGSLGAHAFPVWQFWLTRNPLGILTFGELFLCVAYANMLLALRFPYAVVFNAGALAMTLAAVFTKPGLMPVIQLAFAIQITTACAFALWANYRLERRRSDDYLLALAATLEADEATLEAEEAESARQSFQTLSRTDALTGLPNRRHLAETIAGWWTLPTRLVLLMIDVDYFKLYNDRLGHLVGDECLQRVAGVLAATVQRPDAFCARYGGEEFTVLARVECEEEVAVWAERLVQAVRAAMIPHPARPDGEHIVTVSIGAALRDDRAPATSGALFDLADAALYTAKQNGRDGFSFCSPPIVSPLAT